MTQRQEVIKDCWKNDDDKLAQQTVAENFQFVKNTIKQSTIKRKTRYAYI